MVIIIGKEIENLVRTNKSTVSMQLTAYRLRFPSLLTPLCIYTPHHLILYFRQHVAVPKPAALPSLPLGSRGVSLADCVSATQASTASRFRRRQHVSTWVDTTGSTSYQAGCLRKHINKLFSVINVKRYKTNRLPSHQLFSMIMSISGQ